MKVKTLIMKVSITSVLYGCANNPTVDPNISTVDWCDQMYGKKFEFLIVRDEKSDFGLRELGWAYEPLINNCKREGGALIPSDRRPFSRFVLPTVLNCMSESNLLWSVRLNFSNPGQQPGGAPGWFWITLNPVHSTPDQLLAEKNVEILFKEERRKEVKELGQQKQIEIRCTLSQPPHAIQPITLYPDSSSVRIGLYPDLLKYRVDNYGNLTWYHMSQSTAGEIRNQYQLNREKGIMIVDSQMYGPNNFSKTFYYDCN